LLRKPSRRQVDLELAASILFLSRELRESGLLTNSGVRLAALAAVLNPELWSLGGVLHSEAFTATLLASVLALAVHGAERICYRSR
jgi:hypothetical protein